MTTIPCHRRASSILRSKTCGRARRCLLLWALLGVPGARPATLRAQERAVPTPSAPDSAAVHHAVSPRGALLRALALPGWGHAAIGSYNRGAFYFVAESSTAWALIRTRERLLDARRRAAFREGIIRQDLAAQGNADPDTIRVHLSADAQLTDLNALVTARKSQQEDWLALGIFLVFLSGADAYVSAHLADFPAPISMSAVPVGTSGRMELSAGLHLPRRH